MPEDTGPKFAFITRPDDMATDTDTNAAEFDSHFAIIGRIAATWSALDYVIDLATSMLLRTDDAATLCVTSQIGSTGRRLNALVSLFHLRGLPEDDLSEMRRLITPTIALQHKRNSIVHAVWLPGPKGEAEAAYSLYVRADSQLRAEFQVSKLSELKVLHKQIQQHIGNFFIKVLGYAIKVQQTDSE